MPDIKLTIFNAEINTYAPSANATVTYIVNMGNTGFDDPNIMVQAMNLAPRIGSSKDFGAIPGAPNIGADSPVATFSTHALRVSRVRPYISITNNSKVMFVEVTYESRPRPTFEIGSTAVQEKTDTFLTNAQTDAGTFYLTRQQMTIDWLVKAGTYTIPGSTQKEPPTDVPLPKTTISGTRFRLGSTIRLSSTYYNDEITIANAIGLAGLYTTVVNKTPTFYVNYLSGMGVDDSASWLTTAVGAISMDGGYTMKVFGEFMFNPYGWDTHIVYTEPFTQQLAILRDDVVKNLWSRSVATSGKVADAYNPPQAGAGRFPQQVQYNINPLVGFLSGGTLRPQPDFRTLFTPQ